MKNNIINIKRPITALNGIVNKNMKKKQLKINTENIQTSNKKIKNINTFREINKFNKNTNEFEHLLRNNTNIDYGNFKWIIKLRNYNNNNNNSDYKYKTSNNFYNNKTNNFNDSNNNIENNESNRTLRISKTVKNLGPPSFYQNDLEKYKIRNLKKINNNNIYKENLNFRTIRHLTKNKSNIGTISNDMFLYMSSIRENKSAKNIFINPNKWKDLSYVNKYPDFPISSSPKNKNLLEIYNKIKKYISKPYNINFKKIKFNGNNLIQKTMSKNNDLIFSEIGDHLSKIPYNNIFQEINTFKIKELLKKHNNTQCLFELNLRQYSPIIRKKIRRKGKENFGKKEEDNINYIENKNEKEDINNNKKNINE